MQPRAALKLFKPLLAWLVVLAVFASSAFATCSGGDYIARARITTVMPPACLGRANAHQVVVYLHGIDGFGPSWQELANRRVLVRIAKARDIRFALPRSSASCWNNAGARCWRQEGGAGLEASLALAEAAADKCAAPGQPFDLLGFSNGGFLVGNLVDRCIRGRWSRCIAVGSGGYESEASARDLSSCGRMDLLIGRHDRWHRAVASSFVASLAARKASASLVEYEGGHMLPYHSLLHVLDQIRRGSDPDGNRL